MARMTPELAKTFLGLQKDQKLSRCPDMPNCVCSAHPDDKSHFMDALPFRGSLADTQKKLRTVLAGLSGYRLVEEKPDYWRVEITSSLLKFVDDLEFHFIDAQKLVHFRSASRLGYWDLGANKSRMEKIRSLYQATGA